MPACLLKMQGEKVLLQRQEREQIDLLSGVTNPYYLFFIYHFIIHFQYLILCKTKWILYLASILHKYHIYE